MRKEEIKSFNFEQRKKFRNAIEEGYFDDYDANPREWKHTFVGSFLWKYPTRTATLNRIREIVGHVPMWEDITDDNLRDFVDECQEEGMAMSSVRTVCAELKAVLNANKRKFPSEDFMRILSVKGETSQAVYLTRDEMMRIMNYKPIGLLDQFVKRNFVVEFLTGARRCDAERLTINNCDIDTGTLSYVPQKTPGIIVTVPVDERLHLRDYLADKYYRDCGNDVFNETLRKICKACNIDTICTIMRRGQSVTAPKWELVSSHTARRSFATNLYLAGISLEDIAILMGHGKNIETTKRYICAERQMSSNVMAYFQPQEEEINLFDNYETIPVRPYA